MTAQPTRPVVPALSDTAAMARKLIDFSSLTMVSEFVASQANEDGGFRGRAAESDLYYTVFGIECLAALGGKLPTAFPAYVASHGDGEGLDLVHLCCLARCLGALPDRDEAVCGRLLKRIEDCRFEGGYRWNEGDDWPSAYAGFLALLAHRSLKSTVPEPEAVAASVEQLRARDGGFADRPGLPEGTTTVTAAAAVLCRWLDQPVPKGAHEWLQARLRPLGGFFASPEAPAPDLLSTATAALALKSLGHSPGEIASSVLKFVEDCWHPSGGFSGHAFDPAVDCEYTFYGLLSLGAVAEPR